jgi:hypothetical protein
VLFKGDSDPCGAGPDDGGGGDQAGSGRKLGLYYLRRVKGKLGVSGRAAAVAKAVRFGLIDISEIL